jgi:hypothetical protein
MTTAICTPLRSPRDPPASHIIPPHPPPRPFMLSPTPTLSAALGFAMSQRVCIRGIGGVCNHICT